VRGGSAGGERGGGMKVYYEWGSGLLNKRDEEICGDNIVISRLPDSVIVVLSDGLGSGVKANILATLTTRIASHLLTQGLTIESVVETVAQTLPICAVRKLGYSTLSVVQVFSTGDARIFEYDNPATLVFRGSRRLRPRYRQRLMHGRTIRETRLRLTHGDWVVLVSDGVINAGIGGTWSLGWGWDNVASYLEGHLHPARTAQEVADALIHTVSRLYDGPPGDDVSVAVVKARHKRTVTVLAGPPLDRSDDQRICRALMSARGARVVCGGTTARIVSRGLQRPLRVDLRTSTERVPPTARMEGIDLVTEGVLTLSAALEQLRGNVTAPQLRFKVDGASSLVRLLLESDEVHFLVGSAINPAHQNPDMPRNLALKAQVVAEIAEQLRKRGKEVEVEVL